ncbi:MAG: DNA polymerase III subunit delta [Planctomycetota bacterium]|nr:DNA polymerase III subunit delta [Planctomycetota bacterium]
MAKRTPSDTARATSANRICVVYGAEEMLKREALETLRTELEAGGEPGEAEIFSFDGKSAALADVLDELRSYSLMQKPKIVIVDDADVFVTAHRDALERYAQAPVDTASLVLRSVKWNKGNLDKQIEKVGRIVKCEAAKPADAATWLTERATRVHRAKVEPGAIKAMIERLGVNLGLLDSELAKLAVVAGEGKPVTAALVEEVVGRSGDEEAWRVQGAIMEILTGSAADRRHVVEEVRHLIDNAGQPDVLVAYFVADLVRKLNLALMMKREGVPDAQIARDLKFFGPGQFLLGKMLGRITPRRAAELFDKAVDSDVRSKTGRGEAMLNLECFCTLLQDAVR